MENSTSLPQDKPYSGLHGSNEACQNTDKHLWRKNDDRFAPSIHVTKGGCIGINVGGHVIIMTVEKWHALGRLRVAIEDILDVA